MRASQSKGWTRKRITARIVWDEFTTAGRRTEYMNSIKKNKVEKIRDFNAKLLILGDGPINWA